MRILVQIVKEAAVEVAGATIAAIDRGELVFVGFTAGDSRHTVDKMIGKLLKLRIFSDGEKTNCDLDQSGGRILAVSQFTLYADVSGGNRPSFTACLSRETAADLFKYFQETLRQRRPDSEFGIFHAEMAVSLVNDGPFTVLLDSQELGYE